MELLVRKIVLLPYLALLLAACGGGGGDGGGSGGGGTTPTSYTISGKVSVVDNSTLDGDTNDPTATYTPNDTFATAQTISTPTLVVGHMTKKNEGPAGPNRDLGDLSDVYRVSLQAGQVIELEFAEDPASIDLDLYLYSTTGNTLKGSSIGVNRYECIKVTTTGSYFVDVAMFDQTSTGGSVYQLRISAPGAGNTNCAQASSASVSDSVVAGTLIAQLKSATASNAVSTKSALDAGVTVVRGEIEQNRPVLLGMASDPEIVAKNLRSLSAKVVQRRMARAGASADSIAQKTLEQLQASNPILNREGLSPADRQTLQTIAMRKLLMASGDYEYVELNTMMQTQQAATLFGSLPSNDPFYSRQKWHYELINLPSAMQSLASLSPTPSQRPIVAVLDTGVVLNHPDLAAQLVPGYDFIRSTSSSGDGNGIDNNADDSARYETQPSFHGTHVASTVAAQGFNSQGGIGVAPMALIMPMRVLGERGTGESYSILQGIRFAAGLSNDSGTVPSRRADVINMSLGSASACDASYASAVSAARAQGTIVVAAAGNSSTQIGSPANCAGVVSVSSVGPNKERASYSNFGTSMWVTAPGGSMTNYTGNPGGDGIFSTLAQFQGLTRSPSYGLMTGTSMASPHVAGVMALMRYVHPTITVQQVDSAFFSASIVDDVGAAGHDIYFGYGLINARKAVDYANSLKGGSVSPTGGVQAQPSALTLGAVRSDIELVLARVGTTNETVTSVTASSSQISVAPKAGGVDANRLGTYIITANRSLVPDGSTVFPEVIITTLTGASTTRTIRVPVTLSRASSAVNGDLGPLYVLVFDSDGAVDAEAVAQTTVTKPVAGVYNYSVTITLPAGASSANVNVWAGADLDNDAFICGSGEACGAYPVLSGQVQTLNLSTNLSNIDFGVTPFGGISAQSIGGTTSRGKARLLPVSAPVTPTRTVK
jgi:serine protease